MNNKDIIELLKSNDRMNEKIEVARHLSLDKLKKLYALDKNVIKYISSSNSNRRIITYALESFSSDEMKEF